MPEMIKIEVFKYSELDKKAKEKVNNWFCEHDDYSDEILDDFVYMLHNNGYPTTDVCFSLGYCQGDGVAFYSHTRRSNERTRVPDCYASDTVNLTRLWFRRLIKCFSKEKRRTLYDLYHRFFILGGASLDIRIGRNDYGHRYSHARTMSVEVTAQDINGLATADQDLIEHATKVLEEYIQDDVRDMSHELEKAGYAEVEYRHSEEYINDTAEANDWRFLKSGSPAPAGELICEATV